MSVTQPEVVLPQLARRRRWLRPAVSSLGAVALALVAGGILIAVGGGKPLSAYHALLDGAFGSEYQFGQVLVQTVPLLTIALGLALAFRGRVYNIGAEGQLYVGALAGGALAILLPLHVAPLVVPLTLLVGAAAGGAWGSIVGELRGRWGVNEVISSLLLNYVAIFLFSYVIRKPLRDPEASFLAGKELPAAAKLPIISSLFVHIGIFIALALVPIVAYAMARTPFGFRVRMMGLNAEAARVGGVDTARLTVQLMLISGALAGLAGVMQTTGVAGRLDPSISQGYGFMAIVVALLGRLRPIGVLLASLFMAVLVVGGQAMSVFQSLPYSVVLAIQGVFVVFVLIGDRLVRA